MKRVAKEIEVIATTGSATNLVEHRDHVHFVMSLRGRGPSFRLFDRFRRIPCTARSSPAPRSCRPLKLAARTCARVVTLVAGDSARWWTSASDSATTNLSSSCRWISSDHHYCLRIKVALGAATHDASIALSLISLGGSGTSSS